MSTATDYALRQRIQADLILRGWEPMSKGQLRSPEGRTLYCGPNSCGWNSFGQTPATRVKNWEEVYLSRLTEMYEFITREQL